MPCMLDVTHCVHLLVRSPQVIPRAPIQDCRISSVVAGELYAGVLHSMAPRRERNHAAVLDFLGTVAVLALDEQVAQSYAGLCTGTQWPGVVLGTNEVWVVAHALALGLPLITCTPDRFANITGLATDNWIQTEASGRTPPPPRG